MQEDNERLSNTEEQKLEAWVTTMNSVESIKDRLAGLSKEQIYSEFKASELGPEQLAVVRTQHDEFNRQELQFYAIKSAGERGDPIPQEAQDNIKLLRYYEEGLTDRETDLHISVKEGASVSDDAFSAVRELLIAVRDRISNFSKSFEDPFSTPGSALPDPTLKNSVNERYEAFISVMDSVESQRERMAGLTEEQRFAEFKASELGPFVLAEVRSAHDALSPLTLQVDTTTVLPENLEELLRADVPESRVDTTTVLPDNLEELLRADTPELRVDTTTVLPDNLAEILLSDSDEMRFNSWMAGQRAEDPERTLRLDDPQARAEYAASLQGVDQLAEARAQSDQAWREIRESTAAAQERRSLMTDGEKRQEFAANTPQELQKVKGEIEGAIAERQLTAPKADEPQSNLQGHDRLSNTDQQKFEAWQGVMGSLESEKPRMAILSVEQRRAEYEASQIGPERFQQVRAEHDLVNGYGAVKPAPPEKGSLAHWANELTEAANKTRRPLSGSEFKQIVSSIENCSRGADMEKAKAREVAGLLAKVHGPSGESLFRDPELRNAYKAAITPDRGKSQVGSPANQEAADHVAAKKTATPMRMR
jgi:hypothetical protein